MEKYKGWPRTKVISIFLKDLKYLNLNLNTKEDLKKLKILAKNMKTWELMKKRIKNKLRK